MPWGNFHALIGGVAVVLPPALGFSITVRDPEPSEKHFKNIMVNAFFSGEIFCFACAVYTNVLRTELSVSFLSILWLQAVFLWSS